MTLIARCAGHWVGASAHSRLTAIGLRTGVPVITCRTIRLGRVRTYSTRRIARTGIVTLIARRTGDRIRSDACTGLTSVTLGAGVAVITRTAIGFLRIRTDPGRRIARPGIVTLITCCAGDWIRSDAGSRLATVALGTSISVITCSAVRLRRI